jgi:transglutaminase-like putative cysteine protease
MILMLSIEPGRVGDLLSDHRLRLSPNIPSHDYTDIFGNICTRIVAQAGLIEMRNDFLIADSGQPDEVAPDARQLEVGDLPNEALIFLLGSRYCDTEKLSDLAWSLFGGITPGWQRVQGICDYTHQRICFGYQHARCDRTASEGHEERIGVCRDFAHLRYAVPVPEHSGALLHRLSRRHRRSRRPGPDGFQRLVRGLS